MATTTSTASAFGNTQQVDEQTEKRTPQNKKVTNPFWFKFIINV